MDNICFVTGLRIFGAHYRVLEIKIRNFIRMIHRTY